jgi:hypothetical protein
LGDISDITVTVSMENCMEILQKLKNRTTIGSSNPTHAKEIKSASQRYVCTPRTSAALFSRAHIILK